MKTRCLIPPLFCLLVALGVFSCTKDSEPLRVPAGFEDTVYAGGLASPTAMAFAPDGRLFICEQAGNLRIIKNGQLLARPFLTVAVISSNERGLLGIALDPDFGTNGHVYVYHTDSASARNRVTRFTASGDPDVVDPASAQLILDIGPATAGYHNGGAIHFGQDGMLYIAAGEGHQPANSQSLESLQGKLLRIDASSYPDLLPADNPFAGAAGARGEIWAYGLRNPFTFAVDSETGRIYVNDVGAATWEEIDEAKKGDNYGWPGCEGGCSASGLVNPVYAYNHDAGCAITGGVFYRGDNFPAAYDGDYFFSDWCGKWIRRLRRSDGGVEEFLTGVDGVVDFAVGPERALYYLSFGGGAVHRLRYVQGGNRSPVAALSAAPSSGAVPLTVDFSAEGSSDPDGDALSFNWNFGDGLAEESGAAARHLYSAAGSYTAQLTVSDGRGGTAAASIAIAAGNPPAGTILAPGEGATYRAGDTVSFSGSGEDVEDGDLPASAFRWTIVFHHHDHTHPFEGPIDGVKAGSFSIPQAGETSADVWYRIHLTVTDASGLTRESTRDVIPMVVNFTLAADPPGLLIALDGQPQPTPATIAGVAGMKRALEALSPQSLGGKTYRFVSWSDGQGQAHEITTPDADTTFTAVFQSE